MKAEITKDELIIRIPLIKKPEASKSGKSIVIAKSGGNKETEAKYNGYPVIVGLNAYITKK